MNLSLKISLKNAITLYCLILHLLLIFHNMKKHLLFTLLVIVNINCFASTSVPGGIVNGTWTLAGSPYNVQGSIQIVNGDSLIIQPGVTVNFQGAYKFLVLGKIKAIGTVTDSITFTANDTTVGWSGMRFDNTPVSNDSSIL